MWAGRCWFRESLNLVGYFPAPVLPEFEFGDRQLRSALSFGFLIQLFEQCQLFQQVHHRFRRLNPHSGSLSVQSAADVYGWFDFLPDYTVWRFGVEICHKAASEFAAASMAALEDSSVFRPSCLGRKIGCWDAGIARPLSLFNDPSKSCFQRC